MSKNGVSGLPINVLEVLGNAIVGGMENYVRNLLTQLPEDEFRITLLTPFESAVTAALRDKGFEVYVTAMEDDPPLHSIQTAVSLIRELDIDLIHAHLPKAHALSGLAGALTRRPVVATMHGMSVTGLELGIYRMTGSHLIVVCQHAYNHARGLGIASRDLTLIYNGVDATRFSPATDASAFRRTVGIPPEAPLIGFVGRLAPEKGPDLFVRAAHFAAQRHSEAHFVLVGTGPMEEELRELIDNFSLGERIHLAGMWEDPAAVYPALDVLAQTSRMEGTPLALLEGMACALPTVTIGVGGVIEIVEVGTTGLVRGSGDWEGIGRDILELLKHPETAQRMGAAARQRVIDGFTVQSSAAKTANLFRRLTNHDHYKRLSLPDKV